MKPEELLKQYWGYDSFRGSQRAIIDAVLNGQNVLALLPTGGGKSMCYQIPALAQEGICIVVSPLIALIRNQVEELKKRGIKALALTGGISYEELNNRLDNCLYGNYKFLYLSPERLQQSLIQERIAQMNVNLLAIDEAHCISQWGNDFRPAYLECALLRELKPGVPLIALTATATKEVEADILSNLGISGCTVFRDSFRRDNIAFSVQKTEDKLYALKNLCSSCKTSGIVYVRTRRLAEELAMQLNKDGISATHFHGGLPKWEKDQKLDRWLQSEVRFMVATNAFGMGVDKADVGLVLHYQIPESIEHYYQEAGRAGRDGQKAQAVMVLNEADELQVNRQFIQVLPDIAFLKHLYKKLNTYFQIPYGTGDNTTFSFEFQAFCMAYDLNHLLAYNALQLLDQYSVIALSQNFKQRTTVRFLADKNPLWRYLETHTAMAPVIQVILRTYGGIFDYDTKINTLLIARKASVEESEVIRILERLHTDEIIDYNPRQGDLEVTFLVPREDDLTINRFAREIKAHQQLKIRKVEDMISYLHNNRKCRMQQLLSYFGEELTHSCGQCDVCLKQASGQKPSMRQVREEILDLLRQGSQSSRELIHRTRLGEDIVCKALQQLLESGDVIINSKNEYIRS